jgi:hypothetical protein
LKSKRLDPTALESNIVVNLITLEICRGSL